MRKLIDAIEGIWMATAITGGEGADAVKAALKKVHWRTRLVAPEPRSQPVVDVQLDAACARSGQYGSNPHMIAKAVLAVKDELRWHTAYEDREDEPDMAALARNFSYTTLIGPDAPLHSDTVAAGLSLQGRDTYYPPHAHQAAENYWIVGGDGDWKIGIDPWFPVEPGQAISHETGVRHAMQTNSEPLLAIWLWTSHLDSDIVIVRG